MFKITRLGSKVAITALFITIGSAALGAGSATAVPVNYQSGWIQDNTPYGRGCNAKVFFGRAADGRAYAYGTSTNPACQIKVSIKPKYPDGYPAWSNWGQGVVGAATAGSVQSAIIWLDFRIPAFGPLATSASSWFMPPTILV